MRLIAITLMAMAILAIGCGSPVEPDYSDYELPTFEVWDGLVVGPADLMEGRQSTTVDPGTDMSPRELRQYFAVNIAEATGFDYVCPIYRILRDIFETLSDSTFELWVVVMEAQGYDVPNAPPPEPPC